MHGDMDVELLAAGVEAVAQLLGPPSEREAGKLAWAKLEDQLWSPEFSSARLSRLATNFRLDRFELQVCVAALAATVEPAETEVDVGGAVITVQQLLERLCDSPGERVRRQRVFAASSKLLRHRLIVLDSESAGLRGLLARKVRAAPAAVRFVMAEEQLSEMATRLCRLTEPDVSLLNVILPREQMEQVRELIDHHRRYRELISEWGFDQVLPYGRGLPFLFSGPSGTGKTLLAQAMATHMKAPLMTLSAADLPDGDVDVLLRELFSEATMRGALVLVDECEALLGKGDRRRAAAFNAIEEFEGVCVLTTNHPEQLDEALDRRIIFSLPFEVPGPDLRRQIWEVHLPPDVPIDENIDLDVLSSRYDFTGGTIKNAILVAVNKAIARAPGKPRVTMEDLEAGCHTQLKYALEELTTRTTTHMRLSDIVLPDETMRKVREIVAAIRNQTLVLNQWGFGQKLVTGKGITVLFDGPPGTGKTFCAEIIAGEFDRPLYRVNLPEVVSKWVGETEKHIKQIFEQARISHAMLLFDEADSLFGSRSSEVKSATDRYANLEVNLLLQEIERFPGVCILTTNFYGALDKALTRRIQFRVTFEEPDAEQRELIWKTMLPSRVPMGDDVDFEEIAEIFELTGGRIKNALLRAAYAAADTASPLTQKILRAACRDEYKAAGRVARDPDYVPVPRKPLPPELARMMAEHEREGDPDLIAPPPEDEPIYEEGVAPSPASVFAEQQRRAREKRKQERGSE